MSVEAMRIVRLTQDHEFKPFDCGNKDLNDFLLHDSKNYLKKLLSVTYVLETENETIGYFSVLNDKLSVRDSSKAGWRKLKRLFEHSKHRRDYPAVKVGRLAVDRKFQGKNLGTNILDYIKCMFVENNRTGCAFVTVDALRDALPFYLKNRFRCLDSSEENSNRDTVQMYFDLNEIV